MLEDIDSLPNEKLIEYGKEILLERLKEGKEVGDGEEGEEGDGEEGDGEEGDVEEGDVEEEEKQSITEISTSNIKNVLKTLIVIQRNIQRPCGHIETNA